MAEELAGGFVDDSDVEVVDDQDVLSRFMLVSAAPVGGRQFWDGFRFLGDTDSGWWATVVPVPC